MPQTLHKILVIRNDKLGDFTLALPSFALLKACLPRTELTALVPAYTRDIATLCPAIDQIIIDPGKHSGHSAHKQLLQALRQQQYDAVLTLYSTTRIGYLVWRSGIRQRFAPATKLAQLFYNHRLRQRRSLSQKPEYQYNLDLAQFMLQQFAMPGVAVPPPPYLQLDQQRANAIRHEFYQQHGLSEQALFVFLHPGHGGSANNLSPLQFAELADLITCKRPLVFIISAGPGETDCARQVQQRIRQHKACLYESTQGLGQFVYHIGFADLFISGSTGPLHVAGALNRPTVGFYPNRRSATSLRWQTLSDDELRLAFSPAPDAEAEDMSRVDIKAAAATISEFLNRLYS
ncbi:MAG: glycosyltransferase family 9 protein [Gammaproteobacteria bacterium]